MTRFLLGLFLIGAAYPLMESHPIVAVISFSLGLSIWIAAIVSLPTHRLNRYRRDYRHFGGE